MQNVAWPMMIVIRPSSSPIVRNAVLRAMPVTMPGNAMGRITRNETTSRPKKRNRWTANESSDPRMSATIVAPSAAWTDVRNDLRMASFSNALRYQSMVRPSGGHFGTSPALNEVRTITPIGM